MSEYTTMEKLEILTDAAKYDVACTSSGVTRAGKQGSLGNAVAAGICHSFSADGRCISLLKILQTNVCIYDCAYCVNRRSNDTPRAVFTPDEIADLTINFYKRNYIEGLFLSSGIIKDANYTMELMFKTLDLVRHKHNFNGYIHVKAIPGADENLIYQTGLLADRMSVNIELPSENSLKILAPDKTKTSILAPMKNLSNTIITAKNELQLFKSAPKFVPAGQSTQMIVGASPDKDGQIIKLAQGLYKNYSLKRVFYSAYNPVSNSSPLLPTIKPPLLREHRLYQADWLMRFYGFSANDIAPDENADLDLNLDPKCSWAIRNIHLFPIEVNKADYATLLKVPGVGVISAKKIISARKTTNLDFENLKKLGIVLKRAKFFITCKGKMIERLAVTPEILEHKLCEYKTLDGFLQFEQMNLFDMQENKLVENKQDNKEEMGALWTKKQLELSNLTKQPLFLTEHLKAF